LPQGFTLVRSGKLLSVINLADPRGLQQLDALAELVDVEELGQLDNHVVVKCFFSLDKFDAEDAVDELSALKLMTEPAVFNKTNRLLITGTVGKLKSVKAILDAFQPSTLDDGTVMKNFALQHVSAEDILVVARPHLGLATGEMIGIDVSLSADLQGKNIFVTGVEDKVVLIEGLIKELDKPDADAAATSGEAELHSHVVEGGNVEIVYNVLQTLLAGKSVRLSMDETAGSIVALAAPEVQKEIAETVAQLQASEAEFAVIQLKWIDPYFAVSLLEEMLDLVKLEERASDRSERYSRYGSSRDRDWDTELDIPKIDADPGNMRLFVRAKKAQMKQIKAIIAELDVSSNVSDSSDDMRLFALTGEQARQALVTVAQLWRRPNLIMLYESTAETAEENHERVVADTATVAESAVDEPANVRRRAESNIRTARVLAGDTQSQAPAIRCHLTRRGLLLQSDDTEALDQFCEQLRLVAESPDAIPSPPVVFYLKYAKADDALRTLAELLDGGESAKEAEAETLVNAYVSSGSSSGYFSSIVTSREGTMTLIAGTITVVADSRLNRLIAQGTASDIQLIEGYLKIVDKDSSITEIETYGTSHVINLVNTRASEVAAAIREAYAGRVAGVPGDGGPLQRGSPRSGQRDANQPGRDDSQSRDERDDERRAAQRRPGGSTPQNREPKMTIAVHEPSNSLIVTAPEQLFKEVEELALAIDARNEQSVDVLQLSNPAQVEFLQEFLSNQTRSGGVGPKPSPLTTPSTQGRSD
jgi:type II secretory pathway component GspD/PulD (secretin)